MAAMAYVGYRSGGKVFVSALVGPLGKALLLWNWLEPKPQPDWGNTSDGALRLARSILADAIGDLGAADAWASQFVHEVVRHLGCSWCLTREEIFNWVLRKGRVLQPDRVELPKEESRDVAAE